MTLNAPLTDSIRATGQLRLSDATRKRTGGGFARFAQANADTLARYLGGPVYPGSLNVEIGDPLGLQFLLDARTLPPACVIASEELTEMARYLGDAAAWRAELALATTAAPIPCWVFRRLGSKVPLGVLELLAAERLRDVYALSDRDPITLTIHPGP